MHIQFLQRVSLLARREVKIFSSSCLSLSHKAKYSPKRHKKRILGCCVKIKFNGSLTTSRPCIFIWRVCLNIWEKKRKKSHNAPYKNITFCMLYWNQGDKVRGRLTQHQSYHTDEFYSNNSTWNSWKIITPAQKTCCPLLVLLFDSLRSFFKKKTKTILEIKNCDL